MGGIEPTGTYSWRVGVGSRLAHFKLVIKFIYCVPPTVMASSFKVG